MEHLSIILTAVAAVFAVIGVGGAAHWGGWLTREGEASLLKLLVWVFVPALLVKVVLGNPAVEDAATLVAAPLTGILDVAVGLTVAGAAAWWAGPWLGLRTSAQRRTFALGVGMFNYGFIPYPITFAMYGETSATAGALVLHNVGVETAMWTLGLVTLTGSVGWEALRRAVNPPSVAAGVAILVSVLGLGAYVPGAVTGLVTLLGGAAIPVGLILTGAGIASHIQEEGVGQGGWRVAGAACVLRLGVLPVLFLCGAWLMSERLIEVRRVLAMEAAMPAAMFPIVLARHYGGDPATAVRIVLATSVVGLVTIPVWLVYGLGWVG